MSTISQIQRNRERPVPKPEWRKKVLLVCDAPLCKVLSRWLEAEGYECRLATSCSTARETLRHERFAALMAEYDTMHELAARFLELAKLQYPDTRVFVITTPEQFVAGGKAMDPGADGYLFVPLHRSEVVTSVHALLDDDDSTACSEDG